ncbi:hypothetical protein I6H46_01455 [Anaerococcus obesiensis]|uniref:Uncharacterized protein n=1 Tax=Anaerococcus obesiensis TaxID=1287640 RepID=A0A7T7ZVQ5_9FIRM|nr:hypothetical protein [Anaerococcus obesiensis]QQN56322.1 hypothetical protein I6H46_01455 [Anaerococcus obesiensis]
MKGGDKFVRHNIGKFYFPLVGWFDFIFCKKILFQKQVKEKDSSSHLLSFFGGCHVCSP